MELGGLNSFIFYLAFFLTCSLFYNIYSASYSEWHYNIHSTTCSEPHYNIHSTTCSVAHHNIHSTTCSEHIIRCIQPHVLNHITMSIRPHFLNDIIISIKPLVQSHIIISIQLHDMFWTTLYCNIHSPTCSEPHFCSVSRLATELEQQYKTWVSLVWSLYRMPETCRPTLQTSSH